MFFSIVFNFVSIRFLVDGEDGLSPIRDPNILTCHVHHKTDGTDFYIQSVNNIWMGEFQRDIPKCSLCHDQIRRKQAQRPFKTVIFIYTNKKYRQKTELEKNVWLSFQFNKQEEIYTEEYAVNKHCALCGRALCMACLDMVSYILHHYF